MVGAPTATYACDVLVGDRAAAFAAGGTHTRRRPPQHTPPRQLHREAGEVVNAKLGRDDERLTRYVPNRPGQLPQRVGRHVAEVVAPSVVESRHAFRAA